MNSHLENLIQRFIDGIATPGEAAELSGLIENSEAVRLAYLDLAEVHAALAADEMLRSPVEPTRPKPPLRRVPPSRQLPRVKARRRSFAPWLAAAALIILTAIVFSYSKQSLRSSSPLAASSTAVIAKVAGTVDAVWSSPPQEAGKKLTPCRLNLKSGMAAIEFITGARLLMEGPAEIDLISGMEAHLRSGKLHATVPAPAHGFSITTPSTRVVDLGTRFGLAVQDDGSASIKIMQGKVELHHDGKVHPLETSSAASVDASGIPKTIRIPDEAFPTEENFIERSAGRTDSGSERWQEATTSLADNPATLLMFNFRESTPSSRFVRNQVGNAPAASHGAIVGAEWTQGRWPGKHALSFNGSNDRLLFQLSGTSVAATYLAWVRFESLSNMHTILLMPDTRKKSALQWMIQKPGDLRLSLTSGLAEPTSQNGWDVPIRAKAISESDFGNWVMLASTYDSKTGEVIHYRDGHSVGTGKLSLGLPVKFDSYSFGNWIQSSAGKGTSDQSQRNFKGCLDELAILSRALSPAEIEQLYQKGKP